MKLSSSFLFSWDREREGKPLRVVDEEKKMFSSKRGEKKYLRRNLLVHGKRIFGRGVGT